MVSDTWCCSWLMMTYRWHVHMPKIIEKSISILSDAGLGMAMFSLGEWSQIHSPNPYSLAIISFFYPQHKLLPLLHPHHYFINIASTFQCTCEFSSFPLHNNFNFSYITSKYYNTIHGIASSEIE